MQGTTQDTPTVMSIALAAQERRLDIGWTQEQVADRAGVSRAWLIRFESGVHPRIETSKCLRVLSVLGLRVQVRTDASPVAEMDSREDT